MMLSTPIIDSRAWQRPGTPVESTIRLSADLLAALERCVGQGQQAELTDYQLDDFAQRQWRETRQRVLTHLQSGRGYVILDRLPAQQFSLRQAQAVYWLVGRCLGEPFQQNVQGALLYDVRDLGHKVTAGARFSVTNAESSFHTDNAFGPQVPDIVGLLCLNRAQSGGRSQLVSGYSLHNELLQRDPTALATLYQTFYFDRRGQFEPGEDEYAQHPVFHWDGVELITRYLDYYIRVGHDKAGQPLTTDQSQALDAVRELLEREDLRIEFDLQPGQMLFTNNRWILHNRTAFQDSADPGKQRHYVRLWLTRQL